MELWSQPGRPLFVFVYQTDHFSESLFYLFLIGCMWAVAGEQHVFRKINSNRLVRAEALESVCCHFAEFIC